MAGDRPPARLFRFGDFELDERAGEVRCAGRGAPLTGKPFELLAYLLRHRDRWVPKTELLEAVWPGVFVSDAALFSALRDLRRGLGDDGARQRWVRTERSRGLRFVGPVTTLLAAHRRGAAAPEAPILVGRDAELAALEAALDRACRGRAAVELLCGEAGIGKTRLAQEIARQAEARGLRVLWGRCWEPASAPPFWPWSLVLRALLHGVDLAALQREIGDGVARLGALLPELRCRPSRRRGSILASEVENARLLAFEAVVGALRHLANAAPLLIVLDDLQAGEASSLELLRFVARELHEARVLIVGTWRVGAEVEHPKADAILSSICREPTVARHVLGGLSRLESEALVAHLAEEEPQPALVDALLEHTRGNPLHLEEALRRLRESLDPEARHVGWTRRVSDRAIAPSPSIRTLIEQRLAGLDGPGLRLLEAGSLIGMEFEARQLAAITGCEEARLVSRLDRALEARLLVSDAGSSPRFTFSHPLVREVLHAKIGPGERRRLHLAIGVALEAAADDPGPEALAALAHHFGEAGGDGLDRALRYAASAARDALARHAYEEAAPLFERALRLQDGVSRLSAEDRCELLLGLGTAQHLGEQPEPAVDSFTRAAELARAARRPQLLARAVLGLDAARWILQKGGRRTGVPLLEEAIAAVGAGEPALQARLWARLTFLVDSSRERRHEASARAVTLARRSGDAEALGTALAARVYATWGPGTLAESFALATEMAGLASNPIAVQQGHEWLGHCHLRQGDVEEADRVLDAARAAAERHRICWRSALPDLQSAHHGLLRGRFSEAEAAAVRGLALGQRIRSNNLLYGAFPLLFLGRFLQGRLQGFTRLIPTDGPAPGHLAVAEEREARGLPPGYQETVGALTAVLLLSQLESGEEAIARTGFARLAADGFPPDSPTTEAVRLALLAELSHRLGDTDAAEALAHAIAPHLPDNLVSVVGFGGSSLHWAGVVEHTRGRHRKAVELLEASLEVYRRMEALPWLAWAEWSLARALRARGGPRDAARAAVLLDQCSDVARRLGMAGFEARIRASP